jgi:hypothetical protein
MTPELLKRELLEFRRIKGYLPAIILVHMNPLGNDEAKIDEEITRISTELDTKVRLGYEGMELDL